MTDHRLHLVVATSTRADWGLLSPVAAELQRRGARITVAATNMHLLPQTGMTVSEIEADGFTPVRIPVSGNHAAITAGCITGFHKLLSQVEPDAIIILGDRFEMTGVAQAAVLAGVPIVHIAGGAVSYGAFDDCFRHAITKMSYLHLAETEQYRRRIIQMGEDPQRVVTTGAIGIHNIMSVTPMPLESLEQSLGFSLGSNTLLVTQHAATLSSLPPEEQYSNLLAALDRFTDRNILFTYPNNDVDPTPLTAMIEDYARSNPKRVHAVPSLGRVRYLSALRHVEAVVGNSSGGIVEVPSMGIPTLDIGHRQDGRTHAASVIRCGETADEIAAGLRTVLSPETKAVAATCDNPYARPDTLALMTDTILSTHFSPYPVKRFYDF